MKRILKYLGLGIVVLAMVLVVNTLRYKAPDYAPKGAAPLAKVEVDIDRAVANISAAVRYKTISHQSREMLDMVAFGGFLSWLEATYPKVHATMDRQMANDLTPIYKWQGRNADLKPVLLTGHYDVVPVPQGEVAQWQHAPFQGVIDAGFVWGRGTIDDKIAVIGLLEAAESLIALGFQPEQTIYFVFGHDEEVGGENGAGAAVKMLAEQGVSFAWSLDEGSMVLDGVLPGLSRPIASINVAEKGYVTLNIVARASGGHSSLPPRETAVGTLAAALETLLENPVPGGLTDTTADFFDAIGPDFGFVQKMMFANRWLFGPVLESVLSGSAASNAMMRTTTAPTMLSASIKENVLPTEATATVNFRIHPRDTAESVKAYVTALIDDPRIKVTQRGEQTEPSPVSRHDAPGFELLAQATLATFGDVILVPGLTVAGTDSKHFLKVSDNSYRFNPVTFGPEDLSRIHGINERVSIADLGRAVGFYTQIMQNAGK